MNIREWVRNLLVGLGLVELPVEGEHAPGTHLEFRHVMCRHDDKPISYASVDRIWIAFVRAIEKEGIFACGGISPRNQKLEGGEVCAVCEESGDCQGCGGSGECQTCDGGGFVPPRENTNGC